MIHVVYKGKALPLAWVVRRGKKGHFPEELHIALIEQVQELITPGAQVVVLGDGEFDALASSMRCRMRGGPTCAARGAT